MLIIGCDFHTRFQQIRMVDTTGQMVERRLENEAGRAAVLRCTVSLRNPVERAPTVIGGCSIYFGVTLRCQTVRQ